MSLQSLDDRRSSSEFLTDAPDGTKAELIDGLIVRLPSDTRVENQMFGSPGTLIGRFLSAKKEAGELYRQRFASHDGFLNSSVAVGVHASNLTRHLSFLCRNWQWL